jgi:DNA-binding NarL/FixJ family response regulator
MCHLIYRFRWSECIVKTNRWQTGLNDGSFWQPSFMTPWFSVLAAYSVMTAQTVPPPDRRIFRLMLVDEDPVFRSGLRIWLGQFPEIRIVAEVGDGRAALQTLTTYAVVETDTDAELPADIETSTPLTVELDLVILDIGLGRDDSNRIQGLELCQQIKSLYPALPVLFLSSAREPVLLAAAQQAGADGYCPKGAEVDALMQAIRQVVSGQACWIGGVRDLESGIRAQPLDRDQQSDSSLFTSTGTPTRRDRSSLPPSRLSVLRRNLRRSGLQQIEAALQEVEIQLRDPDLSDLNRALLAGRQRELRTARWVVSRILATPTLDEQAAQLRQALERRQAGLEDEALEDRLFAIQSRGRESDTGRSGTPTSPPTSTSPPTPTPSTRPDERSALAPATPQMLDTVSARDVRSTLFDTVSAKLQGGLENGMDVALEIDILRLDKKRDLLYLILRKVEDSLEELLYSQLEFEQLEPRRLLILQDLWQATVIDFFGRYFVLQVDGYTVDVVDSLLQDAPIVQTAILDKIPGVTELFKHLLFQTPLIVEGVPYPSGNPEALNRAEILLEHLLIQVANATLQPLLNRFANVETIKQNFYDRRLLSNREIERFRNDLSWRYRLERYVREPTDIFESKHTLFVLTGRSIRKTTVYAPRAQELEQLSGIPFVVTLALETRDAVSPRLRSVVSFMGNGVIYVLTEVIGRGIGLVGRGIIKGIGNVWQDGRFNRR